MRVNAMKWFVTESVKTDPKGDIANDDLGRNKRTQGGKSGDSKIFVVWLESFEDSFHFPAGIKKSNYL